ncbi:MAG: AAA family ATPase [Clostridia bacterium]|nr:AAA family ATPase [Clostridia bacterium]
MEEIIKKSEILKRYLKYTKEELLIMRMYIKFNLGKILNRTEEQKKNGEIKFRTIKSCLNEKYDYIDFILNCKYEIDLKTSTSISVIKEGKENKICGECKCKNCIKSSIGNFLFEIQNINDNLQTKQKIEPIEVIDFLLNSKEPEYKEGISDNFFNKVQLIDLMKIQVILENDFIKMTEYNAESGIAKFEYLDITDKKGESYYINLITEYYKGKNKNEQLEINVQDKKKIYNKKGRQEKENIYIISAYYKYLMEVEKIDIIVGLRKLLDAYRVIEKISVRSRYYIYRYFSKVEELPYSRESKDKILGIFNYILNYNFTPGTPYIPINIAIYSNDKEGVEIIKTLIGEFMWYFGYLSENMSYYDEFMNNIILDKYSINKLYYYTTANNMVERKNGVLMLHNFENILYTEKLNQNLILNILTDEMEKNNNNVCTMLYGNKETIKDILAEHPKLGKLLINLELEIDELDIEKVYEILIKKLEHTEELTEEVKEKIFKYIKSTYNQSENQNMEYVNKLYQAIILKKNNKFSNDGKKILEISDIPDVYNTRNLPEIMNELNELVGLKEIKEQIDDLVYLLKFNQKVNIDISKFNLHMIFTGNPGTGKTTVARLISDILYNIGYVKQNKLVEVSSKDLIAEYIGQTAGKTFNVIKSALGGVLFIDEAYALNGEGMKYGEESISTILKAMEDYKDKLVIIFAGYKEEMDKFVRANVGLSSRIGYKINFHDYSLDELMQIFLNLLERNDLKITDEAKEKVEELIRDSSKIENFGNARYINSLFQKVLINHAKNIEIKPENQLYIIDEDDIKDDMLAIDANKRKIGF